MNGADVTKTLWETVVTCKTTAYKAVNNGEIYGGDCVFFPQGGDPENG